MPKRTDISSILIIGAGPIIIGQACEFDYSGTQAVKALKEEGYRIILVNSNPATIMTDPEMADATYVEPITPRSSPRSSPRSARTRCCRRWAGRPRSTPRWRCAGWHARKVRRDHDRRQCRSHRQGRRPPEVPRCDGQDRPGKRASGVAHTVEEALAVLETTGLPSIIRPSFTLGGTGGGIAYNKDEFIKIVRGGLEASRRPKS
jgi:carbamoyl-phosphate synthase large subunit